MNLYLKYFGFNDDFEVICEKKNDTEFKLTIGERYHEGMYSGDWRRHFLITTCEDFENPEYIWRGNIWIKIKGFGMSLVVLRFVENNGRWKRVVSKYFLNKLAFTEEPIIEIDDRYQVLFNKKSLPTLNCENDREKGIWRLLSK